MNIHLIVVGVAQLVERLTVAQAVVGSIPIAHPNYKDRAFGPNWFSPGEWRSLASVPALGAGGRGFESHLPDHFFAGVAEWQTR